ncbi:unnamed protein product [Ilex paraguariensis]|uniref:CASP-like protein n=1 Tax=Ilex paraguariensis TaxID=185542 RepID=A0ABC8SNQ8_9AQUA
MLGNSYYSLEHIERILCDRTWQRQTLMAYLTLAAVAAAAQSSVFAKLGEPELQWMKVCNMYAKFCNQVGEGIASALIVSLSMGVLSGVSAFSLFRLYGNTKGKKSARREIRSLPSSTEAPIFKVS